MTFNLLFLTYLHDSRKKNNEGFAFDGLHTKKKASTSIEPSTIAFHSQESTKKHKKTSLSSESNRSHLARFYD